MSTVDQEIVVAHFIVSDDVERSRRSRRDSHIGADVGRLRVQRAQAF